MTIFPRVAASGHAPSNKDSNMKTRQFAPLLLALAAACAHAAEPTGASGVNQQSRVAPPLAAGPGLLIGLVAAPATADVGKPVKFKLAGSGFCKLTLLYGDGMSADKQGVLPFEVEYAYGTASMNSTDTYKNYMASATPQGACKSKGLAPVNVTINNPDVQGAKPAPSNGPGTVTLDSNKPAGLLVKPAPPDRRGTDPK
ncbi:MAG: hypothetical protein JWN73_1861 [Betaproteobacteria bacterium]|nr:hypothetical protein [Betaproteobacteria bacterium]